MACRNVVYRGFHRASSFILGKFISGKGFYTYTLTRTSATLETHQQAARDSH